MLNTCNRVLNNQPPPGWGGLRAPPSPQALPQGCVGWRATCVSLLCQRQTGGITAFSPSLLPFPLWGRPPRVVLKDRVGSVGPPAPGVVPPPRAAKDSMQSHLLRELGWLCPQAVRHGASP